jgi:hypothetical protein
MDKKREVYEGVKFQEVVVKWLRLKYPATQFHSPADPMSKFDYYCIGSSGKAFFLEIKGRRGMSYTEYDDVMIPKPKVDYLLGTSLTGLMLTVYRDGACLTDLRNDTIKKVEDVDRKNKDERHDPDNRTHIFYYKSRRLLWDGPVLK